MGLTHGRTPNYRYPCSVSRWPKTIGVITSMTMFHNVLELNRCNSMKTYETVDNAAVIQ
jgi:hypothetical protein